jgi:hypothetical protein
MHSLVTLNPTWTVLNEDKFWGIIDKVRENAKQRTATIFFGFARNGNDVKVLEAFTSAAPIKDHIEANKHLIEQLLQPDVGRLDGCYAAGSEGEVQEAMVVHGPFGTLPYTFLPDCNYWNPSWSVDSTEGGQVKNMSEITVHASFKVLDWDNLNPLIHETMQGVKQHNCIFYNVLKSSDGSELKLSECWPDIASLEAFVHGHNGGLLSEARQSGLVTLDSIYVTAPADKLDGAKKAFEAFHAEGFEVTSAFSRLTQE